MSSNLESLSRADQLLDQSRFAEARDAYRALLACGYISVHVFSCLNIAESQERLEFRRNLAKQFPKTHECQLAEAFELLSIGRSAQAVRIYTDLLARSSDPRERLELHRHRLHAAMKSKVFDYFAIDFDAIWNAKTTVQALVMLRFSLLTAVSGVADIKGHESLVSLRQQPWITDTLRAILDAKVVELALLEKESVARSETAPGQD